MKMFPILFDYRVKEEIEEVRSAFGVSIVIALPWPMLAKHEAQAQRNHSQTLARLAERGGLGACEACAVLEDREHRRMRAPGSACAAETAFRGMGKSRAARVSPTPTDWR